MGSQIPSIYYNNLSQGELLLSFIMPRAGEKCTVNPLFLLHAMGGYNNMSALFNQSEAKFLETLFKTLGLDIYMNELTRLS